MKLDERLTGKELIESGSSLVKLVAIASLFGVPLEPAEAGTFYGTYMLLRKYFS